MDRAHRKMSESKICSRKSYVRITIVLWNYLVHYQKNVFGIFNFCVKLIIYYHHVLFKFSSNISNSQNYYSMAIILYNKLL